MTGFTDLDLDSTLGLEQARSDLDTLRLTALSEQTPKASYPIHQVAIQKIIDINTDSVRYSLMPSGELRLGANHKGALAAGDLFFNAQNQLLGITNYKAADVELLALFILKKHDIAFADEIQRVQDSPPKTLLNATAKLFTFIDTLSANLLDGLIQANTPHFLTLDEEEDIDADVEDEILTSKGKWQPQGSSASPSGFFYECRDDNNKRHKPLAKKSGYERQFATLLQILEAEKIAPPEDGATPELPGCSG
ncbi:MAG: hypothetical protein P1U32_08805 [Legionellaceae bacterium]|nr:hypothetical protein [Legionellaceae bacterium]